MPIGWNALPIFNQWVKNDTKSGNPWSPLKNDNSIYCF